MAGIKFDFTADNKNLLSSAKQAQTGVVNAMNGIERAGQKVESTFSKIKESALGGFAEIAKGMAGLTALLQAGNFFKTLVEDAGKFNVAMKEVSTLSDDVAKNLQRYKDQVVDLTTKIPIGATEAAKALYQIESAGHHGADGLNILRESAKGAIGGVTDTATTADAITTILNAYKMEASDAQHISDLLFTTVRLGKTTMGELGHSISQVAPVAAAFGVSIEDVLSAIASLTKQGTPTSIAIRQIRDAITAATTSLGDAAFQGRSFLDAMDEVAKKSQGSNNALKDDLSKLGAINAVLGLTGKNANAARQDMSDMQHSVGAAADAYEKMSATAGAQTTILRNNIMKEILPIADEMRSMSGQIAGYMNAAFDSGAMDKAVVSLEAFIAAYGVYRGMLATTVALNTASTGGMYQLQIAQLQELLPLKELDGQADLQAAVAKGTLTAEQAKLVASLRSETEARYEEIMAAEAQARANLKSLTAAEVSAQANLAAAEEMLAAAQLRMQAAVQGGVASDIEIAKDELNTAERLKNTASVELNTIQRQKNGAAIMVNVTQKNADTAAQLMDNAATNAGTASTGLLATAKLHLKKCIDAVNSSFLASPLFWIAATIVAVTYAVYKLVTAETVHERAIRLSNEALKEQDEMLKNRQEEIEGLVRVIQDQNASTYDQVKAYEKLKKIAPEITNEFSRQALAEMDVAEAQKILNKNANDADFSTTEKAIEELEEKIANFNKTLQESMKNAGPGAGNVADAAYKEKAVWEQTLKDLKAKLEEMNRMRQQALEEEKLSQIPIEVQIKESESNRVEKQRIFDFYDDVMGRVEDIQNTQNTLNFDEAKNKLDAYISEIEGDLSDLHTQVERNPLDQKLKMEENEKTDLLNKLLRWKADMHTSGYTTIPLFFKADFDTAKQALDQARNRYQSIVNQTVTGGSESMADAFKKAKEEYDSAAKEWKRVSDPKNRASITAAEFNKAKSELDSKKSAYEAVGGDPEGKAAKAAAQAARQAKKTVDDKAEAAAKEKADALKHAEEMVMITRDAIRAQEDASIEAIRSQAQRERAEREIQHKRTIEDLEAQEQDIYKKIYDARKSAYENANKGKKYENTEQGAAGWGRDVMAKTLSDEEKKYYDIRKSEIDANVKAENAVYQRSIDDRLKQERQYLYDYLKEYGSIQDQRAAINKEYDEKIAEESNSIQKAALERQRQQAISELNFKEWQKSINWEDVFNDLQKQTTAALTDLKGQLRAKLSSGDVFAEDAKVLAEKIREIEEMLSQRKDPFSSWMPGLRERLRLTNQVKEAEDEVTAAMARSANAMNEVLEQKKDIKAVLDDIGATDALGQKIDIDLSAINADMKDSIFKMFRVDENSELGERLSEMFSTLTTTTSDLNEAQQNLTQAQKNASTRQNALNNFTKGGSVSQYFKDITQGLDLAGWANLISSNVQSMSEVVDNIGLGNTEFGEAVHDFADGVGGFNSAIQSIQSGDVFGAVNGIIDGFQGFGSMLGIGGGNEDEVRAAIAANTHRNELLSNSIDSLTRIMEDSAGLKALAAYEEAIALQKEREANLQKNLNEQMRYNSAHHSFNYYWDGLTKDELAKVNALLDAEEQWNGDLSTITAKQAQALLTSSDIVEKIEETGKSYYGEAVVEKLEALAAEADVIDGMTQKMQDNLTQVSFDSLRDSFLDTLTDMESSSEDFAKSFEDMMFKAMLNSTVLNDEFDTWLKGWQKRYAEAVETQNKQALTDLRLEAERIRDQKIAERDDLAASMGYSGSTSPNNADKSASALGLDKISYEQADQISGQLTAIQIGQQQDSATSQLILTNIQTLNSIASTTGTAVSELRNLAVTRNEYLLDIKKSNREILELMEEKMNNVINKLDEV